MEHSLDAQLAVDLSDLEQRHRLRVCPSLEVGNTRTRVHVDGRPLVSFCSNDYLGLASHPALAAAAADAAREAGVGAGASRLVSGDLPVHRDLERSLAAFFDCAACLVFPTGYQANLGTITALAGKADLIASDALNHASLIDGCRLSRATIVPYRHGDPEAAARALATPGVFRRRFLITESVFSMDGDIPPLAALAAVARGAGASFVVDEAHAVGVVGPTGRGACALAGVRPDVLLGTLGKALGAAGGFVVGSALLRSALVNHARTFIFTTAMPVPVAAAATIGLQLAGGQAGEERRAALKHKLQTLVTAAPRLITPPAAIIPFILGADEAALAAATALRTAGLFVQAIRPPTVAEGSARLRVTLSADHDAADVTRLAAALSSLLGPPPP